MTDKISIDPKVVVDALVSVYEECYLFSLETYGIGHRQAYENLGNKSAHKRDRLRVEMDKINTASRAVATVTNVESLSLSELGELIGLAVSQIGRIVDSDVELKRKMADCDTSESFAVVRDAFFKELGLPVELYRSLLPAPIAPSAVFKVGCTALHHRFSKEQQPRYRFALVCSNDVESDMARYYMARYGDMQFLNSKYHDRVRAHLGMSDVTAGLRTRYENNRYGSLSKYRNFSAFICDSFNLPIAKYRFRIGGDRSYRNGYIRLDRDGEVAQVMQLRNTNGRWFDYEVVSDINEMPRVLLLSESATERFLDRAIGVPFSYVDEGGATVSAVRALNGVFVTSARVADLDLMFIIHNYSGFMHHIQATLLQKNWFSKSWLKPVSDKQLTYEEWIAGVTQLLAECSGDTRVSVVEYVHDYTDVTLKSAMLRVV